ncbi:MAG: cell division ATP-binding protein FtsE [Actinomycetaceae bacterium]|nr:cell division ATP-binding protein FtsE [Actinomycetaceae bacterium]MDY6082395.1 cell division ATP-binding protein FtsE [Actinomycetaceae bacterium]
MITLENVTKIYHRGARPALDSVSLTIDKGEFAFLVGPSGSGKSTLISLILDEIAPTSGKVMVMGKDLAHIKGNKVALLRREVGVVFQDFRLLEEKNVYDNVALALQVRGIRRSKVKPAVSDALAMVGLDGMEKRKPLELSGGERQRLVIARAMVGQPSILLADEPTGNLDPKTGLSIMHLLDRINRSGTTVVMATHDKDIVNQMRKRVIALDEGIVLSDQDRGLYGGGRH